MKAALAAATLAAVLLLTPMAVANTPTVSVTFPLEGATVSGKIRMDVAASDDVAVTKVEYFVDGVRVAQDGTGPDFGDDWNSRSVGNGPHTLVATARDAKRNVGTSAAVTFTVANGASTEPPLPPPPTAPTDTTAPVATLVKPAAAAVVAGATTVDAAATDDVGVVSVAFFVDGTLVANDTAAPWSTQWNSTTVPNGSHTVVVRARDAAGNVGACAPVAVLVDNPASEPPPPPPAPSTSSTARRPYAPDSPWNSLISSSPALNPQSSAIVAALATGRTLTSDPTQYTYPVYEVPTGTPTLPVKLSGVWSEALSDTLVRRQSAPTVQVPIPPDAQAAAGSDGQVVVVDWATGQEWAFWQLRREADGSFAATNGYHYSGLKTGAGAFHGTTFWSRGAGITYLGGLVRPWEIAQGKIEHALAFAYNYPSAQWVYPASKSDGKNTDLAAVPEGTRLQLDPSFDVNSLSNPTARIVARALQTYGMYVIDNSGSSKVMFEYEGTAAWAGKVTRSTVSQIPLSRFRVLAPMSQPASITSTTPPVAMTVAVTSPTAGSTVSGWLRLDAGFTGPVEKMSYSVDGVKVGEDDTPTDFSEPWDSATSVNGTHTVTATAYALDGRSVSSAPVTVLTRN